MGVTLLAALQELRIVELKAELESRKLDTKGVKAVLVDRLHAVMEKEGLKSDYVKQMKKEHALTVKDKKTDGEVNSHNDVQPEDSVSQQGSKVSRHSAKRSVTSSVHSTAKEEFMRSSARKAGLMAKIKALREQAVQETQLQNLIQELEFKKQEGALLVQLAEEEAQQKVYAQCGGSVVGSVKSASAAPAQVQPRTAQMLDAEAPSFQPRMSPSEEDPNLKNVEQHEYKENQGAHGRQADIPEGPNLLEVLLQTTERAQLPPTEVVKFRGDPAEYFSFIRSFDIRIASKLISDQDKLLYLQQYTEGQPKEIVRGCLLMTPERGYQEARRLLHKRYGNEEKISEAHIEKMLAWPNIKPDNIEGLQNFAVALRVCDSVMSNMPVGLRETDHPRTLRKIVEKLPFNLHDRWRRLADAAMENEHRRVSFSDLIEFVGKEARVAANPLYGRQKMDNAKANSSAKESHAKESQRPRTKYGLATSVLVQKVCAYCKKTHNLEDCEELRQKEPAQRKSFIEAHGLCFGCLKPGHLARGCQQMALSEWCASSSCGCTSRTDDRQ